MEVRTRPLLEFLESNQSPFSIPLFQRNYSWGPWQCEVYWQDIQRTSESQKPHFFGTIFYRNEADDSGNRSLSLIDGQQRTITSLLLLSALSDAFGEDSQAIRKYLEDEKGNLKLLPTEHDRASIAEAFGKSEGSGNGKPQENKAKFAELIEGSGLGLDDIMSGLRNFEIVEVELDDGDDAQAIFESFNSKGVSLVTADMVRNYLLLSETPEMQKRLYEEYWIPIQSLFGDDPGSIRLNNALRAWTVIRCKTPKAKSDQEAFEDIKQYFLNEFDGSVEDLMSELRSFCAVWAENYRYHAIKKFRSMDWAKLGRKTLVSDMDMKEVDPETLKFYQEHYGVQVKEGRL